MASAPHLAKTMRLISVVGEGAQRVEVSIEIKHPGRECHFATVLCGFISSSEELQEVWKHEHTDHLAGRHFLMLSVTVRVGLEISENVHSKLWCRRDE